ncbi:hypothetical protein C8R45DRAFT_1072967 [Mycena sanguinolenta]|nr:hypothetical protein C8R45DRAFT_1072967 [Mycena sanguinolenta]
MPLAGLSSNHTESRDSRPHCSRDLVGKHRIGGFSSDQAALCQLYRVEYEVQLFAGIVHGVRCHLNLGLTACIKDLTEHPHSLERTLCKCLPLKPPNVYSRSLLVPQVPARFFKMCSHKSSIASSQDFSQGFYPHSCKPTSLENHGFPQGFKNLPFHKVVQIAFNRQEQLRLGIVFEIMGTRATANCHGLKKPDFEMYSNADVNAITHGHLSTSLAHRLPKLTDSTTAAATATFDFGIGELR